MALASPCGILSDEEECGAVFESTAADIGALMRSQRFVSPLPEISVIISPAAEPQTPTQEPDVSADDGSEKLKVFLRIRPLTEAEQGCVNVQSEDSLLLRAPKDSRNMKSAERGVAQSLHKFTFTKVMRPTRAVSFRLFLAVSDCLCFVQEESTAGHQSRLRAGLSWDSSVSGLSATSHIATQLEGEELSDIQPENYSHSLGHRVIPDSWEFGTGFRYPTLLLMDKHCACRRSRPPLVVPFRDSKLTRVLQSFFCGQGRSCMLVNINPCASTYDETLQALKFSAIATQLVHGPCSKTQVAYILSLLREHPAHPNNTTPLEEEEEEGDITMFDPEALLKAIDVLKREVLRQRQEKEELEATVREQVCAEMMEVISRMQEDFSETLETERGLMEKRCENKLNNLKSSLKKYYSQELEERDEEIRELTAALKEKEEAHIAPAHIFPPLSDVSAPRRLASSHKRDADPESEELELKTLGKLEPDSKIKSTAELKRLQESGPLAGATGTLTTSAERKLQEGQRNLKQLRLELQMLGVELQSGERACCRNTDGEKLRIALSSADGRLDKQDQMLVELHSSLQLVKADLRRKDELLVRSQSKQPAPASGSCKKRGCGLENQPPEKRPFFHTLHSRQPSPPSTPIQRRFKY
uniref:Kinesin-like protein KIF20A n=1 Tax=Sinocyclocheilus rhinocerous TaxID=307959 RepID=A0A673LBZ5_9TELE